MRPPGARGCLRAIAVLGLALLPGVAGAQDQSCASPAAEVRRLVIRGNESFSDNELLQVVATRPSSTVRLVSGVVGTKRCLDRTLLTQDVILLQIYYRKRGYWETIVDTTVAPLATGAVEVAFRIYEGPPILLDSLHVTGLEHLPGRQQLLRGLDLRPGRPFDKFRLQALVDTIGVRLLDGGYPNASVLTSYDVNRETRRASFQITVDPGPLARIAEVRIQRDTAVVREQKIPDRVIRSLLGVRRGDVYRRRDIVNAQRNLYATEVFRHVEVGLAPDSVQPPGDSLVVVRVRLAEGDLHQVQLGVGWANIDCVRAQGVYTDRNFLGGARRLELTGRLSKIGVGPPTRALNALCRAESQSGTGEGNDFFPDAHNYYAAAAFRQPTLFGRGARNLPTITVYSERRTEYKTYMRTTPLGGVVSYARDLRLRTPLTLSYQLERGRTQAEPALFCSVFRICTPDDINQVSAENRNLAVASLSLVHDRTNNPLAPSRGTTLRLEARHADRRLGSHEELQFDKVLGDASWYRTLWGGSVLATRLRLGAVRKLGASEVGESFVPPQERLYAGGPNSVRGFRQNLLGPVVYILDEASDDDIEREVTAGGDTILRVREGASLSTQLVPTGGDRLVVANVELRLRDPFFPELLQWVPFVDIGEVWNQEATAEALQKPTLKVTPGVSLRVLSFLGPIGVHVGYNRYNLPPGPIYLSRRVTPEEKVQGIVCVSPGERPGGSAGACPPAYVPPGRTGFRSRLTIDFSIGQAF